MLQSIKTDLEKKTHIIHNIFPHIDYEHKPFGINISDTWELLYAHLLMDIGFQNKIFQKNYCTTFRITFFIVWLFAV